MDNFSIFDLLDGLPENAGTIVDNLIIADKKINSPIYKKIICSISGGADSDIVMDICTKLDREKKIDYVWFNTGLEYEATKRHIKELEIKYGVKIEKYDAIKPIPISCKAHGEPFVSKQVSENIERLQNHKFRWEDRSFNELYADYPKCKVALRWWCNLWGEKSRFNISYNKWLKEFMIQCPPETIGIKISQKCCEYAKKGVIHKIIQERKYDLSISGIRKYEGGARSTAYKSCFSEKGDFDEYRPIFFYKKEDKEIYNKTYDIKNSECYTLYGLERTGCAGCPFGQDFELELDIMRRHEPKFYKAANNIFAKSYQYTRMYKEFKKKMEAQKRFRKKGYEQLSLFETG